MAASDSKPVSPAARRFGSYLYYRHPTGSGDALDQRGRAHRPPAVRAQHLQRASLTQLGKIVVQREAPVFVIGA